MKRKVDIVRVWKDEQYRASLDGSELEMVPSSPVGMIELTDEDLEYVVGGVAAIDQTGTGGRGCSCVGTKTATSGEGICWCTCPSPAPAPEPGEWV